MFLHKYQALGNDYLVFDSHQNPNAPWDRVQASAARICDRHFGVGSDGILWCQRDAEGAACALRIINPDGSEAEKSGNGLRILARYLWDEGLVHDKPFLVKLPTDTVCCRVRDQGAEVLVEMGVASFDSGQIPVAGPPREVVDEPLSVAGHELLFTAVTVGNPHCVVFTADVTAELAKELGPHVETHALFPHRTNVQFAQVLDEHRIRIEIWERGAGYTLASGSSSSATAAAAVRLGLCRSPITVVMPGGPLEISVGTNYSLTMTGPASKVAAVQLADGFL